MHADAEVRSDRVRSTATRRAAAAAAVALAGILAAPGAALAAVSDHGGAARNDGDQTSAVQSAIEAEGARNVILLIGDGMGDSEITAARNYAYGAAGELPGIDALPLTGQYTTYSVHADGEFAGKPNYTPDSAATGTAWATGTKSYNGAIGVDIAGAPHTSLLEAARANGLRTGNVSTAEIQDATPAVQIAHVTARGCYAPSDTASGAACEGEGVQDGGLGSISEQLLDSRADVTLGGGAASFDEPALGGAWAGETLWDQAADRGYQVVRDADQLDAVTSASQDAPVLGLFTDGNFPTRFAATTPHQGSAALPTETCRESADRLDARLSLGALTDRAIGLLDDPSADTGFFLQVEGASIDKRDHSADACGQIGETIDLDEAVQAALEFAEQDGDTMVIVTADHAHTSQIVGSATPGLNTQLLTTEGSPMIIAYGTSPAGGSQQHTGSQLRIAGYGPGAANVVGLTDQTDVFFTISRTLGLNTDLAALSAGATGTADPDPVEPGAPVELSFTGFGGDKTLLTELAGASGERQGAEVGALPGAGGAPGRVAATVLPAAPAVAGPLGTRDLIAGAATVAIEAPTAAGTYTVTATGAQTGVSTAVTFEVAAAATDPGAVDPGVTDPGAAAGGTGGGAASGSTGGSLATTGATVGGLLALAAALVGAGVAARKVALRRRVAQTA
ncbi:alkaline phosphatase [Cellulomonas sp. Y8]|uniref:alkaline phosphatase n=1 Tax=Cellulomonas sp. Y8 TaxID=2591145 RepID=UPI003D7617D1